MAGTKVTVQQIKDLRDGKQIVVDYGGKQYLVGLGLIQYAFTQFLAGGEVVALAPTLVDGVKGPMEEIRVNI
jgi:hypothetical protein